MRVIKNHPHSAVIYIELWKKKNKNQQVLIVKKDIKKDLLISPTRFRNLLVCLASLNLAEFEESLENFKIELLGATNGV